MAVQWFCVLSKANQEARAATELSKQDFTVFLPTLGGRPMFPRYLFAAFDRDRDNWGVIKSTRGCVDLLKTSHIPTPVPEYAMDLILSYREPEKPVEAETQFEAGQVVAIQNGPLQGLRGLFVSDAKARTMAFLEVMGRRVELPRDSIRAA